MPSLKISQMESITTLEVDDLLPVVRLGSPVKNKNITVDEFFTTIPGAVSCSGYFASDATDTMMGAGSCDVATDTTILANSSGSNFDVFLADGVPGQVKTFIMVYDTSNVAVKPITKNGSYTQILFTVVGQSVTLKFVTGYGWSIVSLYGAAVS